VSGRIKNEEITPDNLHPNDDGHELVAGVITYFIDKVKCGSYDAAKDDITIGKPISANHYENAFRLQNQNTKTTGNSWETDTSVQSNITEFFKNGWTASKEGDFIEFEIESSELAVQYRKSVKQPAPIAKVVIDGDEENKIILDANFKETWGDCLYLETILRHGEKKKRKVRITIEKTHKKNAISFYLVSIIGAN